MKIYSIDHLLNIFFETFVFVKDYDVHNLYENLIRDFINLTISSSISSYDGVSLF